MWLLNEKDQLTVLSIDLTYNKKINRMTVLNGKIKYAS